MQPVATCDRIALAAATADLPFAARPCNGLIKNRLQPRYRAIATRIVAVARAAILRVERGFQDAIRSVRTKVVCQSTQIATPARPLLMLAWQPKRFESAWQRPVAEEPAGGNSTDGSVRQSPWHSAPSRHGLPPSA
jgi:hypothetical protein